MRIHLSKNEEWLLRHLDQVCQTCGPSSMLQLNPASWNDRENLNKERLAIIERLTWEEFDAAMSTLSGLNLVHAGRAGTRGKAAYIFYITAEGRQAVRELDDRDYLKDLEKWFRRHRWAAFLAGAVAVCTALGGLLSFATAVYGSFKMVFESL